MKKVFLEKLPRVGKLIDWKNSIGYKIKFVYDDIEGWIEIIDYNNCKLKIKYNNKISKIYISHFKSCKIGSVINKKTSDFKLEIGQNIKDDKHNLIITDRKKYKGRKYYKYECNKCGFYCGKHWFIKNNCYKEELWIEESGLLKGYGCACCANQVVVEGVNDIATTAPWIIKLLKNKEDAHKYTCNSNKYINIICNRCGFEKEIKVNDLYRQSFSCSKCGDGVSYPNKFMFNLLEQLNIDFETEYSPEWVKPKRYDFYIPSMNLIIEMDGGFHKKDNNMNGQTAEQSKEIDNYKDKLAKEHGLKVIRIDCDYGNVIKRFKYIKKNIIKELHNIFNLNDINWINIDGLSQKSLVKEVCDFWKIHNNINNENITTSEISKIFKIDISIIVSYLKKGTELDWCIYNPKEEMIKNGIRNGKRKSKAIKVFNDFISYTFNSYTELEKLSIKILGVKLSSKNFSYYIKNKKPYKGFYLKNI